ncbi:MAG: hypothetical protein ACKV2U_22390 [Bryobacteraceae bacterium]
MELKPPEQARILDEACRGDRDLRREVESLIGSDPPDQRLWEPHAEPDMAARRVGPYRLSHLIGHEVMAGVPGNPG